MILPSLPIKLVDIVGSVLMIVFAFLCLAEVFKLKKRDPQNVIWTYLQWVCFALAGFAISRSAGHIVKQALLFADRADIWENIRPFSGSVNSIMFMVVAAVTLFFERIWNIYQRISIDKKTLQSAHGELMFLNQNLERLVMERTEALALSEHKYRRIFEVSRDMIMVSGADGTILDMNPAGKKMLGFSEDGFAPVGENVRDFLDLEDSWDRIRQKIEAGGFVYSEEVDFKCRDGATRRALVSAGLDTGTSFADSAIHFLVKDIEQRKLMEQQLAQADKLASIGQLSAGIAHEINNPLGIILGYTQLLLRSEPADSERHQDLRTIEKHVRTCKSIVADLLNFSRTSKPAREMIDLNRTVIEVIEFVRHHSRLEQVEIVFQKDRTLPTMLLDEKNIKQVLINLVLNARHAVGKKGTITLSTQYLPEEQQAIVKVADTGHGIAKKDKARIFDPFFTTKPTGEGTGLGLSVSYGIIKNHGGDIFVESEPGKGATFFMVLPMASKLEEKRG